jgi:hypothetical protein
VENLVTVPSAKEADDITVNMHTEQSHSTSGSERAGIDVGGEEAQGQAKEGG